MKIDKIAQKRALAEYKGKKDYERLLAAYAQLDDCYAKAMQTSNRLARQLAHCEAVNAKLFAVIAALGCLLSVAVTACVWLWTR